MRVLYLTDKYLDFLADDTFYGMRFLFGPDVVDFPKKDILYKSSRGAVDSSMVWAMGSTAFGLPDMEVDREDIERKIEARYFDFIVNSNCWRINAPIHYNMIVLDGEDHFLLHPRYFGRVLAYYKRELRWNVSHVIPIQFSLPDHLLDLTQLGKSKLIHASFSVYPGIRSEIASMYPSEIIDNWRQYMIDIKRSWFGISPMGAGYDCQRHYEILGNAVLCIYLDRNAPKLLRDEFVDGVNCLTFGSGDELKRKIDACKTPLDLIEKGRHALITRHLSSCRAKKLIDQMTKFDGKKRHFAVYSSLRYGFFPSYKRKLSHYIGEIRRKLRKNLLIF